jgi:hypothetical protein
LQSRSRCRGLQLTMFIDFGHGTPAQQTSRILTFAI